VFRRDICNAHKIFWPRTKHYTFILKFQHNIGKEKFDGEFIGFEQFHEFLQSCVRCRSRYAYDVFLSFPVLWMTRQIALNINDRESYVDLSIQELVVFTVFFAILVACKFKIYYVGIHFFLPVDNRIASTFKIKF